MIEELTDKNYEELISRDNKPIFIDFYSPTCGPCQTLTKYLPHLDEYAYPKDVYIFKCNVSNNPKISTKYSIRSVPFTVIVDSKKNIKEPNLGLADQSYYIKLIDKYSPLKKNFFKRLFDSKI